MFWKLIGVLVLFMCVEARLNPRIKRYNDLSKSFFYTRHNEIFEPHVGETNIPEFDRDINCALCKYIVHTLQKEVAKNASEEEIVKIAQKICITAKIQDERVCDLLCVEYKDEFIYVLENVALSPTEICGLALGDTCAIPYNPLGFWNVTFPGTKKPPVVPPVPPKPGSPQLKILHLTDIHTDMMYQEGSNAECGEPLCCRSNDGPPVNSTGGAGKWGDYRNCDSPTRTVENLFQHLNGMQDQFDIIYFTGDVPAHNIWNQTQEDQLNALDYIFSLFTKYLPSKPFYISVGNHESAPCNSYPPPYVTGNNSMAWLYSSFAKYWQKWLPQNTTETIMRGGFFTVSPYPGFRIISINMNYGQNGNWYLFVNATDPVGQFQWLISVLQDAEDKGEKVHILGHIPPGGTMEPFSWNYYSIINRYESTIVGQFFGHMHGESFFMFYDEVNFTRPLSTIYVPGSVTTYSNLNAGFRLYQVDGFYKNSSFQVLNYQNYILNITEANLSDDPKWTFEYDAKKDLVMENLYPADWDNLIIRMNNSDTLFDKYYRYRSKGVDHGQCTGTCKTNLLCGLKKARSHETNPNLCKDL